MARVTLRSAAVLVVAWLSLAMSADAQLAATGSCRLDSLRQHCIAVSQLTIGPNDKEHDAARCRVSRFGAFATLGDVVYYRAIDCLTPHHAAARAPDEACRYYGATGLAIFVADKESDTARLLVERTAREVGMVAYDDLLRNGAWHPIDALGWLKRLRIPDGLAIYKGVWPDLGTMTARIDLYRAAGR